MLPERAIKMLHEFAVLLQRDSKTVRGGIEDEDVT